jgi:hypothetical protein
MSKKENLMHLPILLPEKIEFKRSPLDQQPTEAPEANDCLVADSIATSLVVVVEEVHLRAALAVLVLDPARVRADGKVASPELERSKTERRFEASRLDY